jgi:hypothetical protein
VWVAGEPVQPAQVVNGAGVEQTKSNQHAVQRGGIVAFGREEHVARARALIEVLDLVEEHPAHDFERTETGADMPRPRARDHIQRVDPREVGKRARLVGGRELLRTQSIEFRDRDEEKVVGTDDVELLFTHV